LADIFSIIGFPLSLLALWKAIREAKKAKTASQEATEAVSSFRKALTQINTVELFARTLERLENIKRLVRGNQLPGLPDMFSDVREKLIIIRVSAINLSAQHQKKLQGAIALFKDFAEQIEEHSASGTGDLNRPKMIGRIATEIDELHTTLAQVRKKIEDENNE
jgi:hypothetical protein